MRSKMAQQTRDSGDEAFVVVLTKYNETKDGRHVLLHPQGMLGQAFTRHDVTSLTMHDVTSPLL